MSLAKSRNIVLYRPATLGRRNGDGYAFYTGELRRIDNLLMGIVHQ